MEKFNAFFVNPFEDLRITDLRLKNFTDDHIQKMTAANTGTRFTAYIAATQTALGAFVLTLVGEESHVAARKSRTENVTTILNQFKKLVRTKEPVIRAAFESQPSVITEFFPNGMSEYSQSSVGSASILMERLVGVITARAAALPTGFVTQFNDIKTQFNTARTEQQDEKGHVSNVKAISSAERTNLVKQLYKNLVNIAVICINNPAEGAALFDDSLLYGRHSKKVVVPPPAQ
ncbi:MAG: hypothetical protein ACOYM7_06870 [Paludibacter sp.]